MFSTVKRFRFQRISLKKVALSVFVIYILLIAFSIFILIQKRAQINHPTVSRKTYYLPDLTADDDRWNPWGEDFVSEFQNNSTVKSQKHAIHEWSKNNTMDLKKLPASNNANKAQDSYNIEIWSKADIGFYVWWHIFDGGKLEKKLGGIWSYGFKRIGNMKLKFRTGSGVIPSKVPLMIECLILILSAHNSHHIQLATIWLNFIRHLHSLKTVILIVSGNSSCETDWLQNAVDEKVKVVYMVYGKLNTKLKPPLYPWPVGVDTSHHFPKIRLQPVDMREGRKYECSLIVRDYHNQAYVTHTQHLISKHGLDDVCSVWSDGASLLMSEYVSILLSTDLLLCPPTVTGVVESFEVYEALSAGATPVMLRAGTSGCEGNGTMDLLHHFNAPVISLRSWEEVVEVVRREANLTTLHREQRRQAVITWYEKMKHVLRQHLLDLLIYNQLP